MPAWRPKVMWAATPILTMEHTAQLHREQALQVLGGFPLEGLLPEQQRLVEVYRDEYFQIGASTEPADRPMAERAITALYAAAGHAAPAFEWGESPRWGAPRVQALGDSLGFSVGASLRSSLGFSVGASLGSSLRSSLGASLGSSLYPALGSSLRDSLWGSLRDSLWGSLRDSLVESLRSSLDASLGDSIRGSIWGTQEAYWVGHHVYCLRVLCVPYRDADVRRLLWHDEVVRSCGWWWPYRHRCVCTDRPEVLEWTDAAPPKLRRVRYRDGWEVAP